MKVIESFKNYFSTSEIWLSSKQQRFTRDEYNRMREIYWQKTGGEYPREFTEKNLLGILDFLSGIDY